MAIIWVDFNDVDDQSTVSSLLKFADDPDGVTEGANVTARDGDGSTCSAVVVSVNRANGLVKLDLNLDTFVCA